MLRYKNFLYTERGAVDALIKRSTNPMETKRHISYQKEIDRMIIDIDTSVTQEIKDLYDKVCRVNKSVKVAKTVVTVEKKKREYVKVPFIERLSNMSHEKREKVYEREFRVYQRACKTIPDFILKALDRMPPHKGYIWNGIWLFGKRLKGRYSRAPFNRVTIMYEKSRKDNTWRTHRYGRYPDGEKWYSVD